MHIAVKPFYVIAAMGVLAYAFLDLRRINIPLKNLGILPEEIMFLFPNPFPLTAKKILEPVYLLHFIYLAYVVSAFITFLRPLFKDKILYPFKLC